MAQRQAPRSHAAWKQQLESMELKKKKSICRINPGINNLKCARMESIQEAKKTSLNQYFGGVQNTWNQSQNQKKTSLNQYSEDLESIPKPKKNNPKAIWLIFPSRRQRHHGSEWS